MLIKITRSFATRIHSFRLTVVRLMKGDLQETFKKGGKDMTRAMNPDREYATPDGGQLVLPGRSMLLVRNVGHLMTTDAVLLNGEEVPEGILDGMVTVLAGLHDLKDLNTLKNSRKGSMYRFPCAPSGPLPWRYASRHRYGRGSRC